MELIDMLAKALMSFIYDPMKLHVNKDTVFQIHDPNLFLDLWNAKFVEQVERKHGEEVSTGLIIT
jgi:hypothetical protein